MREQHAIYRHRSAQCPRWQVQILTGATSADTTGDTTLADARAITQARLRDHPVVEHVEHELDGGLYVRQTLDGETVHRDHVTRAAHTVPD